MMDLSEYNVEVAEEIFWDLIEEANEFYGPGTHASAEWLMKKLEYLGPEEAQGFYLIMQGYMDLSYQYGLWNAASVMDPFGGLDAGFLDFRTWLISQGREVYMAALKDPDSLADVKTYGDCSFEILRDSRVYERLTGENVNELFDNSVCEWIRDELAWDIQYGEGIDYPYTWDEVAAYLPKLCEKYITPEEFVELKGKSIWDLESPEIQKARRTAHKKRESRGESRTNDILKLYSPLHADFYPIPDPEELNNEDYDYNLEICLDADGRALTSYSDLLMEAVETEELLSETKRGLMEWFSGSPAVDQKVASVFPRLEEINGVLYGVTVCQLREPLTPAELTELKGYIEGQYADGWGESFEQEARKAPDGELFLHFWKADDFSFCTAQEMEEKIKLSMAAKTKRQHKGVDR